MEKPKKKKEIIICYSRKRKKRTVDISIYLSESCGKNFLLPLSACSLFVINTYIEKGLQNFLYPKCEHSMCI